ncbi:MAG: hypothetical protein ACRCX2_18130 [Paraclostridium sp.]
MNVKDSFRGVGTVNINVLDKHTNQVIDNRLSNNLIVKTGRNTLVNMLAGKKNTSVTKIAIGRGGCADLTTNAFNPIPPTDGDTDLKTKILTNDIVSSEVDTTKSNPKVVFTTVFDCTDVNSLVNECGLFFSDEITMFARYTFDTISLKDSSNLLLQISWTIEF